jgi:ATP-dependent Zn protease
MPVLEARDSNSSNKTSEGENIAVTIAVNVIQLGILCVGSYYLSGWLSRKIQEESQGRVGNTKAVHRLDAILRRRHGATNKLPELNSYEQNMAEDVVDPITLVTEFKDIGGLDEIKQELWQLAVLPLKRPDLFADNALVQAPKGILLYGKPGTG